MSLLDVVLPPACAACGAFGHLLCPVCRAAFRPASDPDTRFLAADTGIVIGTHFRTARAAFIYEGSVRRALQKLKYGGVARLAEPLADAALPTLCDPLQKLKYGGVARLAEPLADAALPTLCELLAESAATTLVPVPVHVVRRRERGYNQAELLARRLARRTGLPMAELLVRTRPTAKQHTLDRAGRLRNLASAFELRPDTACPRAGTVVVVDDIMTTSATLETCAAVLLGGGVREVYGLAIAREV